MGIEMPAEVKWLIPIVVGDSWPEGDETALQRLAEVWQQAATDVDEAMRQAEDAVKQATSHMDGAAADAFKQYWEKFVKGEEATLPKMKDVSEKLATACRNCAMQIEYAKLSIIIALVILAIQIAIMIASAVASFGASTAGIVPAQMATRAGVQIIFRQLVQQLMQQVGRNLIGKLAMQVGIEVATSVATDLAVQGIQLAKGTRDSLDTSLTLDAAKSGLISGIVGAGVGAGMGKAFGDGLGDSIGRSMGRNAAEEALIGAGSALAEGALSEEGIQAKDVLFGATSGAVSGAVSGAKSGIEGLNADIDVPTAGDMPRPSAGDMPRPSAGDMPRPSAGDMPRPDAPPAAPSSSPTSTPDTEPPPRRSSDATNMSYAAPPTEQPQHRPTPDATPASSAAPSAAPSAAQQPQGFQQGPAPAGAGPSGPAPQSAPAAPRSMPMSAAPGFSPGGFSPSSSPSPAGNHASSNVGPGPMSGGSTPGSAASHAPPVSSAPSNLSSSGPAPGGPVAGSPVPGGPTPGGPVSGGPTPSGPTPSGSTPSGPVPGGPTPSGPSHGGPVPGSPGSGSHGPVPTSFTSPNQAPPGTPPQRPSAGDAVNQAGTSTPHAPAPFNAPPNRGHHEAPHQPAPAHIPPQGNAPMPQRQQPAPHYRREAPPTRSTPPHRPVPQQQVPPAASQQRPAPQQQPRPTQPPTAQQFPPPQQPPAAQQLPPRQQPPAAQQLPPPQHPPAADLPRPAAPDTAHPHQPRSALEEFERSRRPVRLPDNLKHLQNDVQHTPAGLSLHTGAGQPMFDRNNGHPQSAALVRPDPDRYTVDIHGSADDVRVGDTKLTPKDLADIIRASGDWDGKQPVRLLSCQTGTKADGFAAQLSKELGVDVVAPTKDAWVDDMGNVFASSRHIDFTKGDYSPGWPPNGDWVTYRPDGTSSKSDQPFVPGSSPTWGEKSPQQPPRAWFRGEPMHWSRDPQTRPIPNQGPPHQVRQPQRFPDRHPPPVGRHPQRPPFNQPPRHMGPPPGMPQGPRFPNQQRGPVHHGGPDRRPPQQHPQRFPNQQPGGPPHPQQWQGNQAGPHRPTTPQHAPQSFGPDPRRVPPQHHESFAPDGRRFQEQRPAEQPHVQHAPEQHPAPQHEPAHRPAPTPPQEPQTTAQGLPWIPLEQQLQITKENPITPREQALRDKAVDLHIASFGMFGAPDRTMVKAEFQHHKVGLDGRFVKVETPPPPPRPAKLTEHYLNQYLAHVSKYGSSQGVKPSFERGSGELPPGRTRQIPHGALVETAVPVHGSEVRFNDEHPGVIWVDQRHNFLRGENAVFRRTGQSIEGMIENGIPPRGTSGNLEAHVANDTANSAYVSFTTDLGHALEREAGKSLGIQNGIRHECIAEAYHPFGIDADQSHHDAGEDRPHDEHERSYFGGMPRENIYRFWRMETVVKNGFVVETRVVGPPVMNPHFKYRSPEGS